MPDDSYRIIRSLLASTRLEDLRRGLALAELEIAKVGSKEGRPIFDMISPLFYIDPLDHPELVSVLDEAVNLAARLGPPIIPVLIESLNAGDFKAQWAVAHVLGRIGPDAIHPMIKTYASATDPTLRAFILYALGKIKSPRISQAAKLALEAAESSNLELRDTATRALGKLAESIPHEQLPEDVKKEFLERLYKNLSDGNTGVRAKAMRSMGKLAKHKHLTVAERTHLKSVCQNILGTDDSREWDRAYRIRREATEVLEYL